MRGCRDCGGEEGEGGLGEEEGAFTIWGNDISC